MPVTMNQFKCANGHEFEANAKLRARCPECGLSTKRSFDKLTAIVTAKLDEPKPEPVVKTEPVAPAKGPVLIRQGRPRMAAKKAAAPKMPPKPKTKTIIGSKVAGGLVSRHRVTSKGARPAITKRPTQTAIARGIKGAGKEHTTPYWHSVADKYGI
jgi:hypothetical protein